jgi:hypothetical protein
VIVLNRECMGTLVTKCLGVLTNEVIHFEGQDHIQFNSMYGTTLKVAKDHHTLTLGPKFPGIAKFGDVGSIKCVGGGRGGSSRAGGRGGWCPPPPKVKDGDSSSSDDDE